VLIPQPIPSFLLYCYYYYYNYYNYYHHHNNNYYCCYYYHHLAPVVTIPGRQDRLWSSRIMMHFNEEGEDPEPSVIWGG